jgi:serine/threonine protein kinase
VSLYRENGDGRGIVTREIPQLGSDRNDLLFECLEMLTHLKHPSIAPLFGIIFPTDSKKFTIATLYYQNGSLKEVLANAPSWWTATAKSKAIAGIVDGMRFAHSLGCAHGSLKPSNILFDDDHNVHITDFCSNRLRGCVNNDIEESGTCESSLSDEAFYSDMISFSSILFEILVGRSVVTQISQSNKIEAYYVDSGERVVIPSFLRSCVIKTIEFGWSAIRSSGLPFDIIYGILQRDSFDIVEGNDVNEVLRFVSFLEASKYE